jgi:CRP/FNR family transcriptional regulator, dissimilatory nitrate respiration regulator
VASVVPGPGVLDSAAMDQGSPLGQNVRQHYLFSGLDAEVFSRLAATFSARTLDKGAILFRQGEPATHFYFVDAGMIELNLHSPAGEKKVLEVLGPGRTFAEAVAFMQGHKYPVTAEALVESRLCQIPIAAYVDILKTNPAAMMRLLSDVCRYLHARVSDIESLTMQNARSRLASYLLDHVVETNDDEATIRLELPRHVIAARLSVKPETLSRLLRGLVDEGILTIEDRVIFVHSLARLRPYN